MTTREQSLTEARNALFVAAHKLANAALAPATPEEARAAELERIGNMMSNVLYNLAQLPRVDDRDRVIYRDFISSWDKAKRTGRGS